MTDINNFKNIADEIMAGINASEELKEKTLRKCMEKRTVPAKKLLAAAACLIVVLGFTQSYHKIFQAPGAGDRTSQEMSIMAAPENNAKIAESGMDTALEDGTFKEWIPGTIAEAGEAFGKSFLEPAAIPEGFKAVEIIASGKETGSADKITLSYSTNGRSFMITEEKAEIPDAGFDSYRAVDINGAAGYVKSAAGVEQDGTGGNKGVQGTDSEVHWFSNGVHYTVAGLITEAEALEVALSMREIIDSVK